MLLSELIGHPDQHEELRRFRYGHVLGPPISTQAIQAWQAINAQIQLPADVVEMLLVVNGIHLWADLDCGRAYFGILPLTEWCVVRDHVAAAVFDELPETHVVISYHDNDDYFLVMDPCTSRFVWFDPQSPADSLSVGTSVEEFLDWWWSCAQELDPRRMADASG